MDWPTLFQSVFGSALGGSAAVLGLSKYLGDRWVEGLKARYSKELTEMQNAFSIGATSHIANVLFDKHIEFCQEYLEGISKALPQLIEGGPTAELDPQGFVETRHRYALWLTPDIEIKLDRFEESIRRVVSDAPVFDFSGAYGSLEASTKSIVADLRKILGIEELTALRSQLVLRSSASR